VSTPHTKAASTAADYTRIVDDLTYRYDGVFDRDTVQQAVELARATLEQVSTSSWPQRRSKARL